MPNSIKGKVVLKDVDDMTQIPNASGVTVAIQGTTISANTNASGDYELIGVAPGIYVLAFSKSGFVGDVVADVRYSGVGVEFLADKKLYSVTSAQISLDPILRLSAKELREHPLATQLQITDTTVVDDLGVRHTSYWLNGKKYSGDSELVMLTGTFRNNPTIELGARIIDIDGDTASIGDGASLPYAGAFAQDERYCFVYDAKVVEQIRDVRFPGRPVRAQLFGRIMLSFSHVQFAFSLTQPMPID